MGGEVDYKKIKSIGLQTDTIQKIEYNTPLSFNIEMWADIVLSDEQVREIARYYFNTPVFHKLYIRHTDWHGIYMDCTINNISKVEGGIGKDYGVVGFKGTVTCSAPWAFEEYDDKVYLKSESEIGAGMLFNNISDSKDYMYPIITIKTGATCTGIELTNTTDNGYQTILSTTGDDLKSKTIIMKPLEGTVKQGSVSLYSFFNKKFFRFVPGENAFSAVSSPSNTIDEFIITYQNVRVIT